MQSAIFLGLTVTSALWALIPERKYNEPVPWPSMALAVIAGFSASFFWALRH